MIKLKTQNPRILGKREFFKLDRYKTLNFLLQRLPILSVLVIFLFSLSLFSVDNIEANKEKVDFIYRGDFQETKYSKGTQLQDYWKLAPWQDTSGFAIEREEEGGKAQAILKINYSEKPKAPDGWEAVKVIVEFMGIPELPTNISFKACGEGSIRATVYEYVLRPAQKKELSPLFAGQYGDSGDILLTKEWKNYEFQYQPSGKSDIGRVAMVFSFKPSTEGRLNVYLDDVHAIAKLKPGVKETSVITIPSLPRKPVIDGNFSENEWADAILLSAFTKANIDMPPSGIQKAWVGYDAEALYIAFSADDGDMPVASTRKRDTSVYKDDSLEILLASTDEKSRAHFILNAANSIFDSNGTDKNSSNWNPEWYHAIHQDAKGWQAEVAIPWKILGWEYQPGATFRINICHNNAIVSQEKNIHDISSWTSARVPGSSNASFSQTGLYAIAHLDDNGIIAGVALEYDPTTSRPLLKLNVSNSTGIPSEVICAYGIDSGIGGRITLSCPQKGRTVLPLPVKLFGSDRHGYVDLKVSNKDGTLIYVHKEIFRTGFSSAIALNNLFPINALELSIDISSLPNFKVVYEVRDASANVISEKTTACKSGLTKILVDISHWECKKPYCLFLEIQSQDGVVLAQKSFEVVHPGREPWLGTKIGLTDEVLPPFTPIKIDGDVIQCLMKEYVYRKHVLPISVKSEGHELLAAPVSLRLSCNGNETDLAAAPLTVTLQKPNRIEWQAKQSFQGIDAEWNCWMEEDGFAWYELTLNSGTPIKIDRLALLVPVKKEFAKLISATPFNITGGDMEGQHLLKPEGWQAIDHKQILSVMSEDRGLEITSEDNRTWSSNLPGRAQQIVIGQDKADILYTFIDEPLVFQGQKKYAFGIQAFPVKPVVRDRNVRYMAANRFNYPYTVFSGDKSSAYIKYPLQGNLNLAQGTLEAWIYVGFDPQKSYVDVGEYTDYQVQRFFDVIIGKKTKCSLIWDWRSHGWVFKHGEEELSGTKLHGKSDISWKVPGWHHIAMTWGDVVRIYDDGNLIWEQKAKGLLEEDTAGGFFSFGKQERMEHSEFRIAGLRISSRPLTVSEMDLKGDFTKTSETLLLENYAVCDPNFKNSVPNVGKKGALIGAAAFRTFEGKTVLSLGAIPSKTRLDVIAELGYKSLLCLGRWSEYHSLPYFETEKRASAFKTYVNACHERGLKVFPGMSFGIGHGSREDTLYGYYWYAHPIHLCGNENSPFGIKTFCVSQPLVTDYYLYYWDKFINDFHVDGIYTDNTFIAGVQCQNEIHGCGWRDVQGVLRQTGNLLAGRRFAKRLYALCKMREQPLLHYMHASRCNHAMYASWADQYLCGEQYRAHSNEKGWNIDLNQFRVENFIERFGLESHMVSGLVPYGHQGTVAVGLLHGVTVLDVVWRNWPERLIENAMPWKIMDKFDTNTAEFLPYWKNTEFVKSRQDKRQYVTLWLHQGKRALALIANLEWEKADVTVGFELDKLGISSRAKDSYTGENIPMVDGKLTIPLDGYNMKLVWIE